MTTAAERLITTETEVTCPGCDQQITVCFDTRDKAWYSECGGEGEGGCTAWIDDDEPNGECNKAHEQAIFDAMYASLRKRTMVSYGVDADHAWHLENAMEDLFREAVPLDKFGEFFRLAQRLWDEQDEYSTGEATNTTLRWWTEVHG